jgi:hypothetical protein
MEQQKRIQQQMREQAEQQNKMHEQMAQQQTQLLLLLTSKLGSIGQGSVPVGAQAGLASRARNHGPPARAISLQNK